MTENKFLYFITNQEGKSFYEANGLVQQQGQPREILHAPDGFQDKGIEYKRDSKWFGVFRNFSFPLGFVLDGKSILNHIRYKLGYEFKAYFLIYILDFFINDIHFGFGYQPYYKGEFDLTTVKKSENKIEVNLMDGGIEAMVKANENTEYEILIEGEEMIGVKMDGISLKNNIQFFVNDGFDTTQNALLKNHVMALQELTREVVGIGGVKLTDRTKVSNNNTAIKQTGQWFFQATVAGNVVIEYDYNLIRTSPFGNVPFTPGMKIITGVRKISSTGAGTNYTFFQNSADFNIIGNNRVSGTVDIPVVAGDELYAYTFCTVEGSTGDDVIQFNYGGAGLFKATYSYRHASTAVLAYHASTVFKKLVEKMTDGRYTADLTYLNKKKEYVITCGDALRGLPDPKIKTSFADFFQWLWSNEDVYFGIKSFQEGNAKIKKAVIGELKDQFQLPPIGPFGDVLQPGSGIGNLINRTTDLGTVRNLELDIYRDKLFNRIKVGCPNQNYEDVNGRTEFNSEQFWGAPVVRASNELDLLSPYREDAIGMEYVRINFGNKTTTDASSDNDTFAIVINKSNPIPALAIYIYEVDRSETITGVIDPASHFNAKFSPKHKLIRKGRYLRSCLSGLEPGKLKLNSAKKNADVTFGSIVEKSELPIATLGEPYFRPDLMQFETPNPINLIELQNSEDLRRNCFKITWNEKPYYGFLHTISIQPWMNEAQTVTLISSHKNDLSTV